MSKLKIFFTGFIAMLVLSLGLIGVQPAMGITFQFNWEGNAGYSAQGSFSYNEEKEYSIITAETLDFIEIDFFDPNKKLLKSYVNVKDGEITGVNPYMEFNFDTSKKSLFATFDIGEGSLVGEMDYYLHGTIDDKLELRNLDLNVLDSDMGTIKVAQVKHLIKS